VLALCVTMCVSFVKIIFLRIYKLFGTYYCTVQGHFSPQVLGFWKLAHCM